MCRFMLRILCVYAFIFKLVRRLEKFLRTSGARYFFGLPSNQHKLRLQFAFVISILNEEFSKIRSIGSDGNREGCHVATEKGGAGGGTSPSASLRPPLPLPLHPGQGLGQPVPFQQVRNISGRPHLQTYPHHTDRNQGPTVL